MKLKRFLKISVLAASLLFASAALACEVRIAVPEISASADPILALNWWSKRMVTLESDTLLRFDEKEAVQPWLAKRWMMSPDKLALDIELRQGLRFSDGSPVLIENVIDSLKRWVSDPTSVDKGRLTAVAEIQKIDSSRLRIRLSRPFLPLIDYLATPRSGIVKISGKNFAGTGPWMSRVLDGNKIHLVANQNYFRGPALCDNLKVEIVRHDKVIAAIQENYVDLADNYFDEANGLDATIKKAGPAISVVQFPTYDVTSVYFTNGIKQSLNRNERKWIFDQLFRNNFAKADPLTKPACGIIPEAVSSSVSEFCLAKDSFASTRPRHPIKLYVPNDERGDLIRTIKRDLQQKGLSVQLVQLPVNLLYAKHKSGEVAMHMETVSMQVPDPYGILSMFVSKSSENFTNYLNPDFDIAVNTALAEPNLETRTKFYSLAGKLLANDYMVIPIVDQTRLSLVSQRLAGLDKALVSPFYSNYHLLMPRQTEHE